MAKQSGIHQLKGKVGGMSYYRQSGVADGLVRKINEGLSSRVKTGDEYANTRLNNEEFKTAAKLVKPVYDTIWPAWRTMMRRFAYADMVKVLLEGIKAGSQEWGKRIPTAPLSDLYFDAVELKAKNGQYDGHYGNVEITAAANTIELGITLSASQSAQINAEGVDGVDFAPVLCAVGISASGSATDFTPRILSYRSRSVRLEDVEASGAQSADVGIPVVGPTGLFDAVIRDLIIGMDNNALVCIVGVLPYRIVGRQKYTLQEKCTYTTAAFDLQAIVPEP